jgi:ZIP family zinc transporter
MHPSKKKAAMVYGTITLHNVPEGFAIASAFAGSSPLGWLVAAAIAIQDFPEGFLASGPLASYGMEGKRSVKYGILSGIVEMLAAIIGFIFLSYVTPLVPYALSFAAGAMTYVILVELIPDAFVKGAERRAAISFILGAGIGFALATLLAF